MTSEVIIAYRYVGTPGSSAIQCSFCGQPLWSRPWPIETLMEDSRTEAALDLICSVLAHTCFSARPVTPGDTVRVRAQDLQTPAAAVR